MFDGRDENALFHQGRRVGYVCNVLDRGLNGKIVEINSVKDDSMARGRWQNSEVDQGARMKADSREGDGFR